MPADVHAELTYMAQHVTADEFRTAALAEVARMQAERDEACAEVAAVVQEWLHLQSVPFVMPPEMAELAIRLDALTRRVHEAGPPVR